MINSDIFTLLRKRLKQGDLDGDLKQLVEIREKIIGRFKNRPASSESSVGFEHRAASICVPSTSADRFAWVVAAALPVLPTTSRVTSKAQSIRRGYRVRVRGRLSGRTWTCSVCHKVFAHFSALSRHKQEHSDGPTAVSCPGCAKKFSNTFNRNRHVEECWKNLMVGGKTCLSRTKIQDNNHTFCLYF